MRLICVIHLSVTLGRYNNIGPLINSIGQFITGDSKALIIFFGQEAFQCLQKAPTELCDISFVKTPLNIFMPGVFMYNVYQLIDHLMN